MSALSLDPPRPVLHPRELEPARDRCSPAGWAVGRLLLRKGWQQDLYDAAGLYRAIERRWTAAVLDAQGMAEATRDGRGPGPGSMLGKRWIGTIIACNIALGKHGQVARLVKARNLIVRDQDCAEADDASMVRALEDLASAIATTRGGR